MHQPFPNYFQAAPIEYANPWQRFSIPNAINRTGSTLTAGGIYALDIFWSLKATTETVANSQGILWPAVSSYQWNDQSGASAYRNVVAWNSNYPSASKDPTKNAGPHVFGVALSPAADNEQFEFLIVGETTIKVIGATAGVYGNGFCFEPVASQVYGNLDITYTTSVTRKLGFLTQNYTEATTPAATAVTVMFCGFGQFGF